MKKTFFAAITISILGLGMAGCSGSIGYTPASTSATNSANTAANTNSAANKNSNTTASSNSTKKDDKPKAALTDEKKPAEGNSKKAKNNPVPASWIDVYDDRKGYSFSVPEGTTGGSETSGGVDVFVAATPAPSEIGVYVLAFNDKTLNKDDLLDAAKKFIEEMSENKAAVTTGALVAESDDYSIADATIKLDGKSNKARILVGTDISDNYIMILVCENEEKFAANEKIIDEIWGSFEIWSGGASNN